MGSENELKQQIVRGTWISGGICSQQKGAESRERAKSRKKWNGFPNFQFLIVGRIIFKRNFFYLVNYSRDVFLFKANPVAGTGVRPRWTSYEDFDQGPMLSFVQ